MATKIQQNVDIEIGNATDEELEQIKNEVLKRLTRRATETDSERPASAHCRVSTLHSKS